MISRESVLAAVEGLAANGGEMSLVELADAFQVPHNTVRGHFSNGRFPETKRGGRSKRVYGIETAKHYGLWLYMSKDSASVLNFSAIQRDKLISDAGSEVLWHALAVSDAMLVSAVSGHQ